VSRLSALFAIVLATCAASCAQTVAAEPEPGSLRGQVLAADHVNPLPHVMVVITNARTGFRRAAATDDIGQFLVQEIPPGPGYVLTVYGTEGSEIDRRESITVAPAEEKFIPGLCCCSKAAGEKKAQKETKKPAKGKSKSVKAPAGN
jgi:hypothetical protein